MRERTSMAYTFPTLPYEQGALAPYISAETLSFHYGKHHKGYVDNLNKLIAGSELDDCSLEDVIKQVAGKADKVGIYNNAAQAWNHTFYWSSLKPGGGGKPTGTLAAMIDASFGSYDNFKAEMLKATTGQFGSGWAWLVKNGDKLEIIKTGNADTPLTLGVVPLLTIDVWEHAYYLDYQNLRPKYAETVIDSLLNWEFAAKNLAA
jgi:superoxide dismutase, Fe-Mn family